MKNKIKHIKTGESGDNIDFINTKKPLPNPLENMFDGSLKDIFNTENYVILKTAEMQWKKELLVSLIKVRNGEMSLDDLIKKVQGNK